MAELRLMGWGDEIMAAGRARDMQKSDPRPVVILGNKGQIRKHEAWAGNPRIVYRKGPRVQELVDGPRCRPYVNTANRWRWTFVPGQQVRGELYLSAAEKARIPTGEYAVVAPMVKAPGGPKDWGWKRYAQVVEMMPRIKWVHIGPASEPAIPGALRWVTGGFREAAAVVSGARVVLVPEGGLHHAAAAFHVPAVVVYGGFITPEITGYPEQIALVDRGRETPCGSRGDCDHCRKALNNISPSDAVAGIRTIMERAA